MTKEQWYNTIEDFNKSKKTLTAYAKENHLSYKQLCVYSAKYKKELISKTELKNEWNEVKIRDESPISLNEKFKDIKLEIKLKTATIEIETMYAPGVFKEMSEMLIGLKLC